MWRILFSSNSFILCRLIRLLLFSLKPLNIGMLARKNYLPTRFVIEPEFSCKQFHDGYHLPASILLPANLAIVSKISIVRYSAKPANRLSVIEEIHTQKTSKLQILTTSLECYLSFYSTNEGTPFFLIKMSSI